MRPGETVATDGTVAEGSSAVDASAVTGESVTVAAEQGVIGLIGYVLLLVAAIAMLFGGTIREAVRARPPPTLDLVRVACAASFCALVIHTLVYASFLEDPLTWVLLGLVAALRAPQAAQQSGPVLDLSSAG